jgi:hypothetical protein
MILPLLVLLLSLRLFQELSTDKSGQLRAAVTLSEVLKAAQSGDRPATLEALRDRLAETIDSPMTTGAELASLARQLVIVTELLDDINEGEVENLVDSLAARRAERVANSDSSRHSTDQNQLGGS